MTPEDIERLEVQRCEAMLSADVDALDRLFDERLLWTHSSGRVDGKRSLIAQISDGSVAYHAIERADVVTRVFGSAAIATGSIAMRATAAGVERKISNRYCAVWTSDLDGTARFVNWFSARAD